MDAFNDLKKDFVARHGVAHARSAEHRGIHRAQGGDDHGEGDPVSRGGAFDVLHNIGRDVPRCRHGFERQHFQASRAEQQVDHGDKSDTADERAREIFLRVFHFGSDEIEVLPAVVRPQSGCQSRKKGTENRATAHSCCRPKGLHPARLRAGGRKKRHANHDCHGGNLDGG